MYTNVVLADVAPNKNANNVRRDLEISSPVAERSVTIRFDEAGASGSK